MFCHHLLCITTPYSWKIHISWHYCWIYLTVQLVEVRHTAFLKVSYYLFIYFNYIISVNYIIYFHYIISVDCKSLYLLRFYVVEFKVYVDVDNGVWLYRYSLVSQNCSKYFRLRALRLLRLPLVPRRSGGIALELPGISSLIWVQSSYTAWIGALQYTPFTLVIRESSLWCSG